MHGRGSVQLTGKLGEVMQESAHAAISCVRARAKRLGIASDFYKKNDLHLHVPEGAIPKDGPSAGIAIATAIVSVLTNAPIRRDVAMTGEITLRGKVLPIGGVKEKLLAANRAGITTVLIPKDNEKDLVDIPDDVRQVMAIHGVDFIDEVWQIALEEPAAKSDIKPEVPKDVPIWEERPGAEAPASNQ